MMTDKEQIMIDGCDVSECLFYQSNFEEDYDVKIKHFCSNWHNSCESINNSNCYFKQLQRKTQECEQKEKELKELKRQYKLSCLDCEYKNTKADVDRYRKALEEIGGLVKKATELPCVFSCDCNNCAEKPTKHWDTCIQGAIYKIADIINEIQEIK